MTWPAVLAGWVGLVALGQAGKGGQFDRLFMHPISTGQEIAAYPTFERVAIDGWSQREPWGVWSLGRQAALEIPIQGDVGDRSHLFIKGRLLLTGDHASATVTFKANGIEIGRLTRTAPHSDVEATMPLPSGMSATSSNRLRVEIIVDQPVSPKALGLSNDPRELGFALVSMKLVGGEVARESLTAIGTPPE